MVTVRAALIGDGRMGREVRALAPDHGVDVIDVLGTGEMGAAPYDRLRAVDVAVEFTEPGSAVDNIRLCVAAGCPVVVGTSGWYDRLPEVRSIVEQGDGTVLWSENFSPGYVIMRGLTQRLAAFARVFDGYDVHLVETHHAAKRDAPSGTAHRLRDQAEAGLGRPIGVTSIRVGHVPGAHELLVDGPFDQVVLRHDVRDRRVFADGALRAARWLVGRRGLYSIEDLAREWGE